MGAINKERNDSKISAAAKEVKHDSSNEQAFMNIRFKASLSRFRIVPWNNSQIN